LVDTALQLLKLNHQQLECERFCQLLYSPYWHNNHQLQHTISLAERSQLEYRLRNLQQRQLRTAQLRQIADKLSQRLAEDETAATQDYTWLGQRIMDFYYALPPQPGKQSAKAWAQLFIAQLQSLGWPGQRRLDSNEYQQLSQFYALFEELSSLDNCAQPLSLADALSHLSALAHKRHYQAKTPDCPITIVGSLEAAGLDFDYCWVLGMQQNNWPPAPAPNPLIPIELQRDKQMPHASAERELGFAQSLTASYLSCAPLVVLSYARMEGDQELQPSPLVKHLEPISPAELFHHSPACALENYRQALYQSRQLCWVDNRYGPGLSAAERQLGGSGVLKQQALCPFNAFAQYRLGAGSWPEPQLGLSPLERGNILHLALELFWQQCKDQAGLLALEDFELETQLEQVGQSAIDEVLSKRFDLGPGFRNIELARLLPILNAWMAEEMQRPAFKVLAIEQSQSLALGPLNLQLRLDRLDEYSDAQGQTQQLLIDYKTGQCSSQSWLGPRTEEPQLPLYSLANHNVNAIAFGQLNASFTGFIGFAAGREPAPGIDSLDNKKATDLLNKQWPGAPYQEDCGEQNWSELQQQWQQELLQLAERYDQGDASLDFKNRLAQEYSADLKGLQRLAEHSQKQTYWQANPGAEPNLSFEF
ncbi:MAG: PD-(D/E)XK nuclease family protein, partial [Cellvibrionaceae bacterium]|nr:PD-(D/E)XK nuclease family protein [Cellvibrionaceae bacterium]